MPIYCLTAKEGGWQTDRAVRFVVPPKLVQTVYHISGKNASGKLTIRVWVPKIGRKTGN